MSNTEPRAPLNVPTLDSIVADLLAGRPIPLYEAGKSVAFQTADARACLGWYRDHPDRWAKLVSKEDADAITDQLTIEPPQSAEAAATGPPAVPRVLYLKSVRAHRFGGIHHFGSIAAPPPPFEFELEKKLTLVEGPNGAGKSSFMSAIMWGLTGFTFCPMRQPEQVNVSLPLGVSGENTADDDPHCMSPITPLPSRELLKSLGDKPLPLDTFVELTFADDNGDVAGTVRRAIQRGPKNSVVVKVSGLSELGLDPLACEVTSRMPALIPHIKLGAISDLGKAVASLIGIKPLQDLAAHANRCQSKLRKEMVKEREAEIARLTSALGQTSDELKVLLDHHPAIRRSVTVPCTESPTFSADCAVWQTGFEKLQADSLAAAKGVLGDSFDHNDAASRDNLLKSVGAAIGLLDAAHLSELPSARRLAGLARLTDEEIASAENLVRTLVEESRALEELARQPAQAVRLQLYARVAGWMRDHVGAGHSVDSCPLCQSGLSGKVDDATGRPVADHLTEMLDSPREFLEKTAAAWDADGINRLRSGVAQPLLQELSHDLPPHPADLITKAFSEELFQAQPLRGTLHVLKVIATKLCAAAKDRLPPLDVPEPPELTIDVGSERPKLKIAITRLLRAIAFARWRKSNESLCQDAFVAIVGRPQPANQGPGPSREKARSLLSSLEALDVQVQTALPISQALAHVKSMIAAAQTLTEKRDRVGQMLRAAEALQEFSVLPALVEDHVTHLTRTLGASTTRWKNILYSPSFTGAPGAARPDVLSDGTINAAATANGVEAPAQHVGNASELRATIFAFMIAFWEYMLETRGGLALLLLDDPQEMFDPPNQRRIANTIPLLAKKGAAVITTTLSPEFGRQIATAAGRELGHSAMDHRRLYPLKSVKPYIVLGKFVEHIEERRRAFEDPKNENDSQIARDYAKDLRIYLENRLCDFFDVPDPNLPKMFTLGDLVGAIRSRHNAGMEAFTSQTVAALVGDVALRSGSELLRLMNDCHHGDHELVQYADVVAVKDHCARVRQMVETAHEDYDRWLRRDTREHAPILPAPPPVLKFPAANMPVYANLAAFTSDSSRGSTEASDESLSFEEFDNHAMYLVACHNFGFAGHMNCRAIVDISPDPVADNRLVIALHKDNVLARRVLRDRERPGYVMLASDATDPRRRVSSIHLPAHEVRLLKVVGMLFDTRPVYPRPSGEAVLVSDLSSLKGVEIVFTVRGASAEPLALNGQKVLGGKSLTGSDFAGKEHALVAVALEGGESVFKRIGAAVPGAKHVRHLEAIGGQGSSMLFRTEEIEDDLYHHVPVMQSARLILGVMY